MARIVHSGRPSNTEVFQSSAKNASDATFAVPFYNARNGSDEGSNRHSHLLTPTGVTLIGKQTRTFVLGIKPKSHL